MSNNLKISLDNGPTFEMVHVDGGEFMMGGEKYGGEKPIHRVALGSFFIGKYPVSQELWQAVKGDNPSEFIGWNRPVDQVSWNDAQEFIKKLNRKTGKNFRLPTEAQWEFAARGGNRSKGFAYSGSDRLKEVGWYNENSYGETKPVGLKFANELGLCDMSGNVWEWCLDWFAEDYYEKCDQDEVVRDPQGPEQGVSRVLRGGSYFFNAADCRVSSRFRDLPDYRWYYNGFRLVLPVQAVG